MDELRASAQDLEKLNAEFNAMRRVESRVLDRLIKALETIIHSTSETKIIDIAVDAFKDIQATMQDFT